MHATLRPGVNIAGIALWAVLTVLLSLTGQSIPIPAVLVGGTLGIVLGILQVRSLRSAPEAFRAATSAMEVRRAFVSTKAGKAGLQVQWAGGLLLVASSLLSSSPFNALFAGFALQLGVRDSLALPEVLALARNR
jgi:hypothetical protein